MKALVNFIPREKGNVGSHGLGAEAGQGGSEARGVRWNPMVLEGLGAGDDAE